MHTFETLRSSVIAATCEQLAGGNHRVLVNQACGTGKTKTELELALTLGVKVVVVFVPTITLASQHRKYVTKQAVGFICSDASVSCDHADLVTLNTRDIADFIKEETSTQRVIFCTYQSSDKFVEVYKEFPNTPAIELAIYDEAHYAAQLNEGLFSCTLNDDAVRFDKRVFFTASPKESILSDDFGVLAYEYSTAQAIADGLIKDYFMAIATVTNKEVAALINTQDAAQYAGLAIAAAKAIKECELSSLISFHSTVKGAKDMANSWNRVKDIMGLPGIEADYVDGFMSSSQIKAKLDRLAQGNYILTSCQVIGVGVDVPEVDGLIFSDPKEAHISIQQAVGRGQRKTSAADNAPLPIILPVIVDDETIQTKFKALIRFLRRLREHGIGGAADKVGKAVLSQVLSKAAGGISMISVGNYVSQEFIDAIELEINGGTAGREFDPIAFAARAQAYEDFIASNWDYPVGSDPVDNEEKQLADWASKIRITAEAGALSDEKRAIIEQIIPDFIWMLRNRGEGSAAFEKRFYLAKRYVREYGVFPPASHPITQWFKETAIPTSTLSQAAVVSEQWDKLKATIPGYYESFRDTSRGLTNDVKDKFLQKIEIIQNFYNEYQCTPGVASQEQLYVYVRRLKEDLKAGKFPERMHWLKENFPEFFVAPQQTLKPGINKVDITPRYHLDLTDLARFVCANGIPTIENRDVYRTYKLLMRDYENGDCPKYLWLFVETFLK